MATTGETISVHCECGKKLKAPATAVGKKAKCPGCGNVLVIEAPPPPVPEDDPLGALYDLADAEQAAASSNQVDDSPHCPKCGATMDAGAVLCVNCGYDMRTGGKASSAPKKKVGPPVIDPDYEKKHAKKQKDKMAPDGKFIVGLAASLGFALLGGVVWFLIAYFAKIELGFISIGIGALAGIGMQIGQKGFSNAGGLAAAGVTFLVLVAARFAVIIAIVLPAMGSSLSDISGGDDEEYDEDVVQMMANQELRAKNIDPSDATEAQDERAYNAAIAKLKKMPKSEYQAMIKKAAEEADKDVLIDYVTDDTLRQMKVDPENASETQHKLAHKTATAKVNGMNANQREAELKRLQAAESAHAEAEAKKAKSSGNATKDSGPNASVIGFGIVAIIFLVFGFKGLLFLALALGLAYRTASGSVSG